MYYFNRIPKFWYVLFSFSFSLIYSFLFSEMSYLTHRLFSRSMLFKFCLEIFFVNFLILLSSLILLWFDNTLCFQLFLFKNVCFVAQNVVCFSCSMDTWKKMCFWLLLGGVFCKCLLDLVGWWCCWIILYFAYFPYMIRTDIMVQRRAGLLTTGL